MGVPGLWDILNKVGKSTSLAQLAIVHGFEQNSSGRRGYRIGIDVSIWFHHASFSKGGENCELRGLFFRLVFLAKLPIIPLFVFDGRERPRVKRGSRLGKSGSHALSKQFKEFLDAFGMEWREARGEAEAELAILNREGHIDAIMTDDCDALIFGACTIIKNISSNLSGNKNNLAKNETDKTDNYHSMVYRATDIESNPEVNMTRGGLILFALLAGGDYHKGVEKIGKIIAHALARCEFGDLLLEAYQNLQPHELRHFLCQWRARVNLELKHNTGGFLPHRTSLSLPDTFPDLNILDKYASPLHHKTGRTGSIALRDRASLDLGQIARLCETYFEWGYREKIVERFRSLLWPCAVTHLLRRVALEIDEKELQNQASISLLSEDFGTPASMVQKYLGVKNRGADKFADVFVNYGPTQERPLTPDPHPLITRVVGSRQHTSTDGILEYRVEISPVQLINLTDAGIKGTRWESPQATASKKLCDPNSSLRMWVPAVMLNHLHPSMVERYVLDHTKSKRKRKGPADSAIPESPLCTLSSSLSTHEQQSSSKSQKSKSVYSAPNDRQETGPAVVLDPWITPNIPQPLSPENAVFRGFLFTFDNPDFEEDSEDEFDAVHDTVGAEDPEPPLTRFDRLCDHILTSPTNNRKCNLKRTTRERPNHPQTAFELPIKKRQKTSSGSLILDILDLI